jgi:DNA-directed RNA polymerase specialized sigma24 family protein
VTRAEEFEELRPLLFANSYRILGSVGEAEDAVQETLGPTERAVFVLREVFETPYDEIAEPRSMLTPAGRCSTCHWNGRYAVWPPF